MLEKDLKYLMAHCEELANADDKDWRLKKYIKSLDSMLFDLESQNDESEIRPYESLIEEYRKRCAALKAQVNYVDPRIETKKKLESKNDSSIKEINQIHKAKYATAVRNELMGNDNILSNLRQRKAGEGTSETAATKNFEDMQEKIASDMLILTKSLKDHVQTANKIIKKDTEIVQNSAKLTDKNFGTLEKESEKLQDHSKRAWKCWMWLMIGVVMMIFIFMVMFMKVMKKKA